MILIYDNYKLSTGIIADYVARFNMN